MPSLNPTISSILANDVYALVNYSSLEDAYIYLNRKHKGAFNFSSNNLIKGKTGGPAL